MNKRPALFISLWLGVFTFAIFWPVVEHDFVNFDDRLYVTENPVVQQGLTMDGAVWAFQTNHASNWHPVVWLSHMMDCSFFGLFPGGHHLTNLLLHVLNTVLLFLLLRRMTGAVWRSAMVAALFGWHPLHVESVAWVAERKDVLSTLFWILTVWAYARYVETPKPRRYALTLLLFALGLMTKPMLVTLPFVLLLLDFWPLGRLRMKLETGLDPELPIKNTAQTWRKLLWEKWPLFALSVVSAAVTIWAQHSGGAIKSLDATPLAVRLVNATAAYGAYLWKMVWPADLAVLYPMPAAPPFPAAVCSLAVLAAVSFWAVHLRRQRPALITGWLWFLGTLVPVIGLVQVGAQAWADRYTYVPLIGVFIMLAWGLGDWKPAWPMAGPLKLTLAGAALVACAFVTSHQLRYWQDGATLFEHAVRATEHNYIAHNNFGTALSSQGRSAEAMTQFREALRLNPDYAKAHFNLATDLANAGETAEALVHLREVVRLTPRAAEAHNNLGVMLAKQGQYDEAMAQFATAIKFNPEYLNAYLNEAAAYAQLGRFQEAVTKSQEALQLASGTGQREFTSEIQNRLEAYRAGKPYRGEEK